MGVHKWQQPAWWLERNDRNSFRQERVGGRGAKEAV